MSIEVTNCSSAQITRATYWNIEGGQDGGVKALAGGNILHHPRYGRSADPDAGLVFLYIISLEIELSYLSDYTSLIESTSYKTHIEKMLV